MNSNIESLKGIFDIGNRSDGGVLVYDQSNEIIIYANPEAQKITGLKKNSELEEIKKSFSRVVIDDQAYFEKELAQILGSSFREAEFRINTGSEKIIHVCCSAFVILDERFIVLFIDDISLAKQHESYLLEFGIKKNTLLHRINHQVHGALLLMQHLSIEAGKMVEQLNPKGIKGILDLLYSNSKHSIDIIAELLKDEHTRSPDVYVKTSRFNIMDKMLPIFDNLSASYKDRTFTLDSKNDSIALNSDELKVLQIISIFTSNAVKFTGIGKKISCYIKETDSEVIISIADDGIGIPDELKPFIFDRNSSASRRGIKGEQSIGIGLFISKELAHLVNGKVWFLSSEGLGSTFYLSLPKVFELKG